MQKVKFFTFCGLRKKENHFNLINQDKLLVVDNKKFKLIANEIRSKCNHRTLELSRDFIKKGY